MILVRVQCFVTFIQRPATLAASFLRYTVKFSRVVQRARANGLHRSSSTLPERNALGRCVKCVYASARPFRHYTIRRCNCQLVVPGANFLVRPFARTPASPSAFFSKRRSGLTPFERMTERNSFREYDKRWTAVFFPRSLTTAG